jgi:hypothetical protein
MVFKLKQGFLFTPRINILKDRSPTDVPRIGVGLFVLNSENRFLLGERLGSLGACK